MLSLCVVFVVVDEAVVVVVDVVAADVLLLRLSGWLVMVLLPWRW